MSDTDIPAEGVDTPDAPAETPAAGSEPVEQPTTPATEETPKAESKASAPAEPVKPTDSGPAKESKPLSRRSAQFRIEQLARENAELRKNQGKPSRQPDVEAQDDDDPQPDETPDVRSAVREEAQRILEPVLKEHSKAADENELTELFTGPNAGKKTTYESKIREAWNLPQYKDVAASDLLKLFSYEADLAKAKAEAVDEYKRAQKEAKESSGTGTSARSSDKTKTAWEMTDEEFKKATDKVRMGS